MSLVNNSHYDDMCETTNPFIAAMQVAKTSRDICNSLPNRITMSTAMSYAAEGRTPNPDEFVDHRMDRVYEYLCGVEDPEVAESVRLSYLKSLEFCNLVYVYDKVHDPCRRSKVRIIMRMLWKDGPYA